jgi:hypothetical protein
MVSSVPARMPVSQKPRHFALGGMTSEYQDHCRYAGGAG